MGEYTNFLLIGGMLIVFYMFFIRPQQKKAKDGQKFLEALKKGDKVVTIGGVHGRILKDEDTTFLIEVDTNVKIRVEKSSVSMDATNEVLKPKEAKEEK